MFFSELLPRSSGKLMISSRLFGFVYLDKIVDFLSSIDNTVLQKELGRTNVRMSVTVGI